MTTDALLRITAVAAAVALLAAPYAGYIRAAATAAAEAVRQHSGYLTRVAAAGLLIAAAWGKVPMPTLPTPEAQVVIEVEEPTPELRCSLTCGLCVRSRLSLSMWRGVASLVSHPASTPD